MHVFTYGTLIFPEVWQAVVGRPFATIAGRVSGFALYRVRDAVFPGMVATTTGETVPGVVYLDVDQEALARLDQFEDEIYRRETVPVTCDDGHLREADTYVVPPEHRPALTEEPWTCEAFAQSGDLGRFMLRYRGFARLRGDQESDDGSTPKMAR
jgi:gamma-glutamylcyclotransferase (GGCT)/AIG2-like uncharacterized protein YtfP